jgi:hypothetical protein
VVTCARGDLRSPPVTSASRRLRSYHDDFN